MAYAAALIAGAAVFWLALSPAPFAPEELIAGAVTAILILLAAWRLRLLDREGAPYLRAPGFAALMLARAAPSFAGNLRLASALSRADMKLYPALLRLKLRADGDSAAAALGGAITLEPGLLAVDCDSDSMLVHALVEDDADETDLGGLERLAAGAVGEKVRAS